MTLYNHFIKKAQERIGQASEWLEAHGLTLDDADRLNLGYMDPDDTELIGILDGIYKEQGAEPTRKLEAPYIIVPYDDLDYWTGIAAIPESDDLRSLGLRYLRPKAGAPQIWNRSFIKASGGKPIILAVDMLDALLFRAAGAWVTMIDYGKIDTLASAYKAEGSSTLIVVPSKREYLDNAKDLGDRLSSHGVPTVTYDFSNWGDDYEGAARLIAEHPDRLEALKELLSSIQDWNETKGSKAQYLQGTTGAYLADFKALIGSRTGREAISTGFDELDRKLEGGLYPGLYILGAISSLGKTTFTLQMADHIAASGRDVLFFSLEQSKDELISKSLARIASAPDTMNGDQCLTPNRILYHYSDLMGTLQEKSLERAIAQYAKLIGPRMFIIEDDVIEYGKNRQEAPEDGDGESQKDPIIVSTRVGLDTIRSALRDHIRILGRERSPVVFIDYLQILRPDDETGRKSDKQNMDETVSELRRLTKEYQIPIFAISSINRAAYSQPISMESFKESGAIEYSSDVLIGLEPKGLGEGEKAKSSNPQTIQKWKDSTVREVQAEILKNRMGRLGSVFFTFDAMYGLYRESTAEEPTPGTLEYYGHTLRRLNNRRAVV